MTSSGYAQSTSPTITTNLGLTEENEPTTKFNNFGLAEENEPTTKFHDEPVVESDQKSVNLVGTLTDVVHDIVGECFPFD